MRIKTIALAAAAAVSAASAPAIAAPTFNVAVPAGSVEEVPSTRPAFMDNNNFHAQLAGLGYTHESIGAGVTVVEGGIVTFEFLGSESGYADFMKLGGALGVTVFSENTLYSDYFGGGAPTASFSVGAGVLDIFFGNAQGLGRTANGAGGSGGFAVFLPSAGTGSFSSNVIYFGYDDDNLQNPDDNHDDMIIRATISAVPEASTWAMMIAGFAAVGMTVRRRSQNARVSFS